MEVPEARRPFVLPATAALLLGLVVAALVTESAWGRLSPRWLDRVGFAGRDLWELEVGRVFTSALVTHGPRVLIGALVMTALAVGLVERRVGPWRALAVFWGAHTATVVSLAVLSPPLHATIQSRATEVLLVLRDVGPSAGYFGAAAFGLAVHGGRGARVLSAGLGVWLVANLFGWVSLGPRLPQKPVADLAHVVAFAIGLALSRWTILNAGHPPTAIPTTPVDAS